MFTEGVFSVTDRAWTGLKYCVFAVIWLMYNSLKQNVIYVVLTIFGIK